uniref:F-box domain-containing protein n=1 Tax=Tetranychus urticae TaxID=32264 RepID=T1K8S4_TETUR
MLINELPDDCLLAIFDQFNDLHHLIACFKVCLKWSHLIAKRAKKVKYLMDYRARVLNYSPDYVYYRDRDLIDVAGLSSLFPNLIVKFIRKHEPLREMITSCRVAVEECCDNLEMLAIDCSKPGILQNCICSKQLSIRDDTLFNLESEAQYRQNLERLQIILNGSYLNGPVLEKLKVVVMHSNVANLGMTFYGLQFMDSCPNLQSAHITINSTTLLVDETLKHESLQDLVIHCRNCPVCHIEDEDIKQLLDILPNLVIFDIRGNEFENAVRAAKYVQNYFERNGRSTKFYHNRNHHKIKSDWPQLYTKRQKICRGFDFMERFFLKYPLKSLDGRSKI